MTASALCILFLVSASSSAAGAEEPAKLPSSRIVEMELAGGESHGWQIALATGDFLRVTVEQRGIDVTVEAFGPDGHSMVVVDSPNGRQGPEPLTLIAERPGDFRVVVRAPSKDASLAGYEIRASVPRPASDMDRRHHAAERLELQAYRAGAERNAQSYRESARLYRDAVSRWQALAQRDRQAVALLRLGTMLRILGEKKETREVLEQALQIFRRLDDRFNQAATWDLLALLAWAESRESDALAAGRSALAVWQVLGHEAREATTLNTLGLVNFRTGRLQEAREAYGKALVIFRRIRDRRAEAVALHNLGGVLDLQGDPVGALENYGHALEVAQDREDRRFEAEILHNRGELYFRLGEAQKALQHYGLALPIFQQLGDRRREAAVLGALGLLHLWLRDFDRALIELGNALDIEKEIGDRQAQAWSLFSLAAVYRRLENPAKALAVYRKSLDLLDDFEDPRGRASILTELGAGLVQVGLPEQALAPLTEAVELREGLGAPLGQTMALLERGRAHQSRAHLNKAAEDFDRALELSRYTHSSRREAEARHALAGVEMDRRRWRTASDHAEQALELAESLRAGIAGHDLRASFFTSLREIYERSIRILTTRARLENNPDFVERAFEIAERARARGFLDQLQETRLQLRRGVVPDLLDRERRLRLELDHLADRRRRLWRTADTIPQATALEPRIERRIRELEDIEAEIRVAGPRYALLTKPVEWSLETLRSSDLDGDTILLEYFLGREQSFLWVVTAASVTLHELPPQARIESLVRRVYRDLSTADPRRAAEQRQGLGALADMLLGPLEVELQDEYQEKRLLIVADGAVQYVPFATLPLAGKPLIVKHEIVHLPSAMILEELRRPRGERPLAKKTLALFADPVFSSVDPRMIESPEPAGLSPSVEAMRAKFEPAGEYKRLPWTRREADAILAAVGPAVPKDRLYLATGFDSNLEAVLSPALGDYRILHFATHGEIDSEQPRLSSLVFSLLDASGRARDGFLRLHHIFSLELGADLVVLSGCRTALGRDILGEGLQSLTRGFFHAGAPAVMASLWSVQDEATAELMRRFYGALFAEKLAPAAALRRAQISMWEDRRYRDPFYWGAFILQGEWQVRLEVE